MIWFPFEKWLKVRPNSGDICYHNSVRIGVRAVSGRLSLTNRLYDLRWNTTWVSISLEESASNWQNSWISAKIKLKSGFRTEEQKTNALRKRLLNNSIGLYSFLTIDVFLIINLKLFLNFLIRYLSSPPFHQHLNVSNCSTCNYTKQQFNNETQNWISIKN